MEYILGLGLALPITTATGVSVVTGVAQGVSEQQKVNEEAKSETRQMKFHVDARMADAAAAKRHRDRSLSRGDGEEKGVDVEGGIIVLKEDKLFIEPRNETTRQPANPSSHPFTGFYIFFPDEDRPTTRGLVSTISRDPPVLNWIYVDKDTYEVKYANRSGSIAHLVGDWDWTEETGPNSCLTFDGWEGFLAVRDEQKRWQLYFDVDDDGLRGKMEKAGKKRMCELNLKRRVISEQEVNKWGLGSSGNLGVKKTEHTVKGENKMEDEDG